MTRNEKALRKVSREAKLYRLKLDEAEVQRDALKEAVVDARNENFHLREIETAAGRMFSNVTVYNWTTEPKSEPKKSPINTLRRMRNGSSK